MARSHRFFLPATKWQKPFALEGSEAHHMATVLRLQQGEEITLLDGKGREGVFRIVSLSKKKALLEQESIVEHPRPECRVWIAPGWNRATRRGWFLEKAVELGAFGIIFWQSRFSQGKTPEQPKTSWVNQCISATKQCANPWLPELSTCPQGINQLLESTHDFTQRIFLWEDAHCPAILAPSDMTHQGDILLVLGPEGGFSSQEIAALHHVHCTPRSLGTRILRWETAALLSLGIHFWEQQRTQTTLP